VAHLAPGFVQSGDEQGLAACRDQRAHDRVDAATARAEAAQFQILSARESLALRAVAVYLDVLRNQEILAHIRAHEAKLDDYIKRIESMVAEGVVD